MKQLNNGMQIYHALSDLARRYQFRSRDEICCYGLTVSQCYALKYLAYRESAHMTELSTQLSLDVSTTTRLVDHLVQKKLVVRSKSFDDARVRNIQVTEAGKRIATHVQEDMVVLLEAALSGLPGAVIESLPEALARITVALNECCTTSFIPTETIRKVVT